MSSRAISPSSTSCMTETAVKSLDSDAMSKIVSGAMGTHSSAGSSVVASAQRRAWPVLVRSTTTPWAATRETAPG